MGYVINDAMMTHTYELKKISGYNFFFHQEGIVYVLMPGVHGVFSKIVRDFHCVSHNFETEGEEPAKVFVVFRIHFPLKRLSKETLLLVDNQNQSTKQKPYTGP